MVLFDLEDSIHYIVTKTSNDGLYEVGERWGFRYEPDKEPMFAHYNDKSLGRIVTFSPPKKTDKSFLGMEPMNSCRWLNVEQFKKAIEGMEVVPDIAFAKKQIAKKEKEIKVLKEKYKV